MTAMLRFNERRHGLVLLFLSIFCNIWAFFASFLQIRCLFCHFPYIFSSPVCSENSDLTDKLTIRKLFEGSVQWTTGAATIPLSDIPYTYILPVIARVSNATTTCTIAGYNANRTAINLINGSPGYSGALNTIIYGLGWN